MQLIDFESDVAMARNSETIAEFKRDLEEGEANLREHLCANNVQQNGMIDYKSYSPITLEEILEKIAASAGARRVRNLKCVWTNEPGTKTVNRLRNLVMLIKLKGRLNPAFCSFQDAGLTEAEKEHLNALGVHTPPFAEFLGEKIEDSEEDVLDLYYMVHFNLLLLNNFIAANWNERAINKLLLIHNFGLGAFLCHSLPALRCLRNDHCTSSNRLFLMPSDGYDFDRDPVELMNNFPLKGPLKKLNPQCDLFSFAPPFFRAPSADHNHPGLVEATTFEHVLSNIATMHHVFFDAGKEGIAGRALENIGCMLNGRKLKRIRIIGNGFFANKFSNLNFAGLAQLAYCLAIREMFHVDEVFFHEPCSTQFERDFLNHINVATPPVTRFLSRRGIGRQRGYSLLRTGNAGGSPQRRDLGESEEDEERAFHCRHDGLESPSD